MHAWRRNWRPWRLLVMMTWNDMNVGPQQQKLSSIRKFISRIRGVARVRGQVGVRG